MKQALTDTMNQYLDTASASTIYNIGESICVIENPSFDILPNYPYRSPIIVAIYCQKGMGKGRINAQTYDICRDTFFIVQPGQITELIEISDDFKATYIIMTEEFTDSLGIGNTFNLSRTIAEYPLIELDERSCRAIESYLTMCRDLAHETGNPHREEILRLTTRAFFLGLGHTIHKQHTAPKERGAELTTKFLRLVEAHYRTHRNLSFYAEQMSLTPKYLSTAVKATSGKSAMQWIEYYVILDASSQLSSTERTIKEIAYDLNFPSQSFFGKYFSRIVGLSPLAYRRKRLQTE